METGIMDSYGIRGTEKFLRRKFERMRDHTDFCLMNQCDWDGVECPFVEAADCERKLAEAGIRLLDAIAGKGVSV